MRRGAHRQSKPQAGRRSGRGRPIVLSYVPALDGLRAVSVSGLMLYHGGLPSARGGFLTIDVFFVLSGFLITSLLLGEWARKLTIKLGAFWARRARRLLPALLVMLAAVAIATKLLATPGQYANLRLDVLSTLFYVANWHFIAIGSNYFVLTAQPSPLQHMWSLSIEEQFYIIWPPVVLVLLQVGRRLRPSRRLWPVMAAAGLGALGSALDMALSYRSGASVMRLYESTDTRSQDILIGAALAIGMAMWAERRRPLAPSGTAVQRDERSTRSHPASGTAGDSAPLRHRRDLHRRRGGSLLLITAWEIDNRMVRMIVQALGWAAVGAAVYLVTTLKAPGRFLFQGGYLVFATGVAVVLFCVVTAQTGALARSLGNPVFRYVGRISYGLYLWHFPLFAFVDGGRLHLFGYELLAVRITLTFVVATASYYVIEQPIRQGRFRSVVEWKAWLMTTGAFLGVIGLTVAATMPAAAETAGGVPSIRSQYSGPPVRVLVVGDSVAATMAFAMLASQPQQNYDVNIVNGAIIACGILRSTGYRNHGLEYPETRACNTSSPPSEQWPALWKGDLKQFNPNVVILAAGRWEVSERLIGGQWMHIGEPVFDAQLMAALEQAVAIATSKGALLDLMTAPCYDTGEQPNGQPWPEDSPVRLAEYNAMVRRVARQHPATVHVDNFGSLLCPGGVFTASFNGVQVRSGDGVHILPTAVAGSWLDARVLPEVIRLGRIQMAGRTLLSPGTATASTPSSPVAVPDTGKRTPPGPGP